MKKTNLRMTGLLFLLIAMLGLAACGSSETVTLEGEQMGMNTKITFEAKDDQVEQMSAELAGSYSAIGLESKEEAELMDDMLQAQFEDVNASEGAEVEISYEEEEIIISINIDFTVASPEELSSLGFNFSEDTFEDEDLSLEDAVSDLEEAGLKVVED
ncbi:DUF1307 domain-containing protein [Oceanobacillus sp. CFH 90083]|uniref:DUF1307 domain-containing protein n=1 Tax=Oceanobacillus sp. CFH 90083 TaxID=2592336 RepID=UPI00128DC87F|nr:DUF1307 domain-containing protein [Oceanobacillus sp. CFH 90083]